MMNVYRAESFLEDARTESIHVHFVDEWVRVATFQGRTLLSIFCIFFLFVILHADLAQLLNHDGHLPTDFRLGVCTFPNNETNCDGLE